MSYNTEKMISKMNSKEVKKNLDKYFKELNEKEDKRKHFEVHEQDDVMVKLLNILIEHNSLDGEQILYSPEKYDITEEQFYFLFSNIEDYAEKNNLCFTDEKCYFHNSQWHCMYKDTKLIFKTMSGQGTANWIVLAKKKEWNKDKCFDYKDYKLSVEV